MMLRRISAARASAMAMAAASTLKPSLLWGAVVAVLRGWDAMPTPGWVLDVLGRSVGPKQRAHAVPWGLLRGCLGNLRCEWLRSLALPQDGTGATALHATTHA